MILNRKKILSLILFSSLLAGGLFSQTFDVDDVNVSRVSAKQSQEIFADALNAYKNYEWNNSIFLFKKLHSNPENITPESMYILIMAQTYAGQYKQAADDCTYFLNNYPNSQYVQLVVYQKGKNLYQTGDYEKAIITLSDFCHNFLGDFPCKSPYVYIPKSVLVQQPKQKKLSRTIPSKQIPRPQTPSQPSHKIQLQPLNPPTQFQTLPQNSRS